MHTSSAPALQPALRPFDRTFDRAFDQLVDSFFSPSRPPGSARPSTSTWEDGALKLTVDLPGIPQDAVDVSVAGRALTIGVEDRAAELAAHRSASAPPSTPSRSRPSYVDGRLTVTGRRRVARGAAAPDRDRDDEAPAIEAAERPRRPRSTRSIRLDGAEPDTSATA